MTTESKPRRSPLRRISRWGLAASLLLAALVGVGPYLLSTKVLSDWVLRRLFADVHGTVTAERLELGWFSPPQISGFVIRSVDGQPVVSIGSITAEQPLWQLVTHPAEIGHVNIEQPHAYLVVTKDGTNFAATFQRDPNRRFPARWRQEAMRVAVEQGAFSWQLAGSPHQWSVGGLQLGVELLPAWLTDTHAARFVIEPGTVVDHAQLTAGMCDDVLKYIAPPLFNAAAVDGSFSLAMASGTLELDHIRDVQLDGTLTLHEVDVGAGGWLQTLVKILQKYFKLPGEVTLARQAAVKFEVAKGRVHHSGLQFGLPELSIQTSGWVGFDESLDLLAEVKLQLSDSTVADRPVLRALNNRVLRLPIKGTLKRPTVEWGEQGNLGQGLLSALEGKLSPEAAAQLPDQLQAGGLLSAPPGESSAAADLGLAAGALLKQFGERRRERLQERSAAEQQANEPPAPAGDSGAAASGGAAPQPGTGAPGTAPPPKRGALGQVLRAVVEAAAEAADQPAAPPAAAPPSGPSLSPPANPGEPSASGSSALPPPPPAPAPVPPVAKSAAPSVAAPPPPLLSNPLPAAPFQPPANNPGASAAANPGTSSPPSAPPPTDQPRRPLGRALRALVEAAADASAQPSAAVPPAATPQSPPPQIPAAPPSAAPGANVPSPPADNPRREALRRLFRSALDVAAEAASQPPASTPASPPPPAPVPPVPAPDPAPPPAPAPE